MRTYSYEFSRKGTEACTLLFSRVEHCDQAKQFRWPLPPQTSSLQPIAEPPPHSSTVVRPLSSAGISTHSTLLQRNNCKSTAADAQPPRSQRTRPIPN